MNQITQGLTGEQTVIVSPELTARHLHSGSIDVFATPAMIALMEAAAMAAVEGARDPGTTSVGTFIEVRHLAATPLGEQVRARAEVTGVDGRQVTFRVQAWDQHELIGEGTHTRVIVEVERFMKRVESKR